MEKSGKARRMDAIKEMELGIKTDSLWLVYRSKNERESIPLKAYIERFPDRAIAEAY
jgi:hypothetical protein